MRSVTHLGSAPSVWGSGQGGSHLLDAGPHHGRHRGAGILTLLPMFLLGLLLGQSRSERSHDHDGPDEPDRLATLEDEILHTHDFEELGFLPPTLLADHS